MLHLLLSSHVMEETAPSKKSELRLLSEISFPEGPGPVPHAVRFLDPCEVAEHFAHLPVVLESAEKRWARKAHAEPFRGL
jgi:hypothetical protein